MPPRTAFCVLRGDANEKFFCESLIWPKGSETFAKFRALPRARKFRIVLFLPPPHRWLRELTVVVASGVWWERGLRSSRRGNREAGRHAGRHGSALRAARRAPHASATSRTH